MKAYVYGRTIIATVEQDIDIDIADLMQELTSDDITEVLGSGIERSTWDALYLALARDDRPRALELARVVVQVVTGRILP